MLTIVGSRDGADVVHEEEDEQKYFSQHQILTVLQNIGHVPAREASADVENLISGFLLTLDERRKRP